MKYFSLNFFLCILVSASLAGCGGSYHAKSVNVKKATLVDPALLSKGTDDGALYRYKKADFDVKKYDKILVAPVQISKGGKLGKRELENYQKLANNAYIYLSEELAKDYKIVKAPEPGTMKIQWAIIDADRTEPLLNTVTTIMPIGIGLSLATYVVTDKQLGVGEITAEMLLTDATTGELLGAAVDRRIGGKNPTELWSTWYNADEALKYWTKRTRWGFCNLRGEGDKCIEP